MHTLTLLLFYLYFPLPHRSTRLFGMSLVCPFQKNTLAANVVEHISVEPKHAITQQLLQPLRNSLKPEDNFNQPQAAVRWWYARGTALRVVLLRSTLVNFTLVGLLKFGRTKQKI